MTAAELWVDLGLRGKITPGESGKFSLLTLTGLSGPELPNVDKHIFFAYCLIFAKKCKAFSTWVVRPLCAPGKQLPRIMPFV